MISAGDPVYDRDGACTGRVLYVELPAGPGPVWLEVEWPNGDWSWVAVEEVEE